LENTAGWRDRGIAETAAGLQLLTKVGHHLPAPGLFALLGDAFHASLSVTPVSSMIASCVEDLNHISAGNFDPLLDIGDRHAPASNMGKCPDASRGWEYPRFRPSYRSKQHRVRADVQQRDQNSPRLM